jgi:16S rRNA (guanine527-N7)-methyltransferase
VNATLLAEGLAALSLPATGPLLDRLLRYGEEIERQNPALGLVHAEGDELVIKHLLDSLAPLALIRGRMELVRARRAADRRPAVGLSLADLGTGAGLPGVPLALALPELRVSLVDRMTRRTSFLAGVLPSLGLENAEIVEEQVEHVRERRWDLLSFRAFRPFERKLFKAVFSLCAPDGFVLAYKGKVEKARAELGEIGGLYASAEILPIKVPFLEDERCLVVMSPAHRAPRS